jgi:hypothetical protein
MGGYGSGRRGTRKLTVEECRTLNIAHFPVCEFALETFWMRILSWTNYADEVTASVSYTRESWGNGWAILRFWYVVERRESESQIEEHIQVVTTRPYFGGLRWWFVCPLIVNGRVCQRRVRKLYLPRGGRYFGCRHCYHLTYESVRTHDDRIGRLLRNPYALLKELNGNDLGKSLLAMKALFRLKL